MILCCGETLIDMLPVQDQTGETCYRPHCGGAAFNSAIALGRLGVDVALISGISSDQFGRQLQRELYQSQVDCELAVRTDRPTTLAFVELNDGQASYRFWDQGSAMREIRFQDFSPVPDHVSLLLFGGISLCNDPIGSSLVMLARSVQKDKLVMLDLNIRPGFAEDETAYRARLDEMISLADVIKLSEEDLDLLYPGNDAQGVKLQRLRSRSSALLLFTRGAQGAVAVMRSGVEVVVAAPEVTVVDTVGAGDSFNAGFLASLIAQGKLSKSVLQGCEEAESEASLRMALELATRVASLSVSRAGANPPWQQELAKFTPI